MDNKFSFLLKALKKKGIQKTLFLFLIFNFFFNNYFEIYARNFKNNILAKTKVQNIENSKTFEIKIKENNLKKVLKILKKYDQKNAPRKEIINGRTTYIYKKLENEPKKSIKELEFLINNPEQMEQYEKFIIKAILSLISNGVEIYIKDIKRDISAEWIYRDKSIIFNKKSLKDGTKIFAHLLSHEIIHVSQSCKGGSFSSYPALLNLDLQKPKSYYYKYLKSNAYKDLKEKEIMLEIEAYANEKKHAQTLDIFNYFCLKK